jgi:hypothetical protein
MRSRLLLAFDASTVSAGRVSWGGTGPRLEACSLLHLPPGALLPSPVDANLASPEEVRGALRELRRGLGNPDRGATLVLPAGVARTALLDPPAGARPQEYAQFRLTQGLPYPASEAMVDVMALGHGRFLGAAVRRPIVAEYEEAASAAGWRQERLDLLPLAALDGLLRRPPEGGAGVDVILGDVSLSLAAYRDGGLRAFRSRLRDPDVDEAARVQAEAERTASAVGLESPRVRVVGPGARAMIHALGFRGLTASAGWDAPVTGLPLESCELAWLGAAR